MSSSNWHPVCRHCYRERNGREPTQFRKLGWRWDVCCWCGRMTDSGLTAQGGTPRHHATHASEVPV